MTDKLIVVFSRNKDRKTANMFIDDYLWEEDIPFVPTKAMDHRGVALYLYALENNLEWQDFALDELTERPDEVERGFFHMTDNDTIDRMIEESNAQRKVLRAYQKG